MKAYRATGKIFSRYKKLSLSYIFKLFLNFSKFEPQYSSKLHSYRKNVYEISIQSRYFKKRNREIAGKSYFLSNSIMLLGLEITWCLSLIFLQIFNCVFRHLLEITHPPNYKQVQYFSGFYIVWFILWTYRKGLYSFYIDYLIFCRSVKIGLNSKTKALQNISKFYWSLGNKNRSDA